MIRRTMWVVLTASLLLATVAGILLLLLRYEPTYYRNLAQPSGKDREERSGKCMGLFNDLYNTLAGLSDPTEQWNFVFTQDHINSFLDEHLVKTGMAEKFLPEGVREPRFSFQKDRVRLGFHYEVIKGLSSVVTVDVRFWLAQKEPNAVVLELLGMKAGALPISSQSLLERVSETARAQNIDVTWYRYNGHPAALLRFRPSGRLLLQSVEIHEGSIRLGGTTQMQQRVKGPQQVATPPVAN